MKQHVNVERTLRTGPSFRENRLRRVNRNAREPSGKLRHFIKRIEVNERLQQGFLQYILCIFFAPSNTMDHAESTWRMAPAKFDVGQMHSPLSRDDEGLVG